MLIMTVVVVTVIMLGRVRVRVLLLMLMLVLALGRAVATVGGLTWSDHGFWLLEGIGTAYDRRRHGCRWQQRVEIEVEIGRRQTEVLLQNMPEHRLRTERLAIRRRVDMIMSVRVGN